MQKLLAGIVIGLVTFSAGLSVFSLFDLKPVSFDVKRRDLSGLVREIYHDVSLVEEPVAVDDEIQAPQTIFHFPRSGTYYIETDSEADYFNFDLILESYTAYPTIKGVTKPTKIIDHRASSFWEGIDDFHKSFVKIDGKNIYLKTQKINNTRYVFEGKFEEEAFTESDLLDSYKPVLKGIMVKFFKDKKVSEKKVEFAFTFGC
jgi:hypothetical protein